MYTEISTKDSGHLEMSGILLSSIDHNVQFDNVKL